jgi:thiamine-phosphate pyrophosphorylase
MFNPSDLLLYLCTDRGILGNRSLTDAVEQAIAGGVTLIQIREKDATSREFYEIGLAVHEVTSSHQVPLIVNDRLDIAQAIGAEGLHVGQSDLPAHVVRRILGPAAIIGVSARTVETALEAQHGGADYIGTGAVYPTGSKLDAGDAIGLQQLAEVVQAIDIPVVGIGGITPENAPAVIQAGAVGISLISAILGADDIEAAARRLRTLLDAVKP